MKIHLLRDRTALLIDDKKPTVTVEPFAVGVLEIEGQRFQIAAKGTPTPCIPDLIGCAHVSFTDGRGLRYVGLNTQFVKGTPYTVTDFTKEYVKLRVTVEELERRVDNLAEAYHHLSADAKHDSLGFLTKNTRKTED